MVLSPYKDSSSRRERMNTCFVCLNSCSNRNRFCPRCLCYAHPKCWGEYLQHTTYTETVLDTDSISTIQPLNAQCPQCKQDIPGVKPITRQDTEIARFYILKNAAVFFSYALNDCDISASVVGPEFAKLFKENRSLISDDKEILLELHKFYKKLHEKGWEDANLHHYSFFGTQLHDSSFPPTT